jgi:hypothetical protein
MSLSSQMACLPVYIGPRIQVRPGLTPDSRHWRISSHLRLP